VLGDEAAYFSLYEFGDDGIPFVIRGRHGDMASGQNNGALQVRQIFGQRRRCPAGTRNVIHG